MDRPRQASDRWATPRPLSRRTLVLSIGLHIALLVPPAILLSSQPPRREIGPIAAPDKLQFAPGLPKTRSGKIMRRILRKISEGQPEQIGDTTTLADPHVVEELVKGRL